MNKCSFIVSTLHNNSSQHSIPNPSFSCIFLLHKQNRLQCSLQCMKKEQQPTVQASLPPACECHAILGWGTTRMLQREQPNITWGRVGGMSVQKNKKRKEYKRKMFPYIPNVLVTSDQPEEDKISLLKCPCNFWPTSHQISTGNSAVSEKGNHWTLWTLLTTLLGGNFIKMNVAKATTQLL